MHGFILNLVFLLNVYVHASQEGTKKSTIGLSLDEEKCFARIKMQSYNIWTSNQLNWDKRKNSILKIIQKSDADIIGFQGFVQDKHSGLNQWYDMTNALALSHKHYTRFVPTMTHTIDNKKLIEGIAIFSRFKILQQTTVDISDSFKCQQAYFRIVSEEKKCPATKVRVFNARWSSNRLLQKSNAEKTLKFINGFRDTDRSASGAQLFLLGLNEEPDPEDPETVHKIKDYGFKDAWIEHKNQRSLYDEGYTYNANGHLNKRLDRIYVRSLKPKTHNLIIHDAQVFISDKQGYIASDHGSVTSTLILSSDTNADINKKRDPKPSDDKKKSIMFRLPLELDEKSLPELELRKKWDDEQSKKIRAAKNIRVERQAQWEKRHRLKRWGTEPLIRAAQGEPTRIEKKRRLRREPHMMPKKGPIPKHIKPDNTIPKQSKLDDIPKDPKIDDTTPKHPKLDDTIQKNHKPGGTIPKPNAESTIPKQSKNEDTLTDTEPKASLEDKITTDSTPNKLEPNTILKNSNISLYAVIGIVTAALLFLLVYCMRASYSAKMKKKYDDPPSSKGIFIGLSSSQNGPSHNSQVEHGRRRKVLS